MNTSILHNMVNEGHVPVVATVAEDIDSTTIAGQVSGTNGGAHLVSTDQTIGLNVNADTAAGSIASAMNAEKRFECASSASERRAMLVHWCSPMKL